MFDPIIDRHKVVYMDSGVHSAYIMCSCGAEHDATSGLLSEVTDKDIRDFKIRAMSGLPCRKVHFMRIANLARLLPNPQPMTRDGKCSKCRGYGRVGSWTEPHCEACNGYGSAPRTPDSTHALPLYIKALILAKGEDWFNWLFRAEAFTDPWRNPDEPDCMFWMDDDDVRYAKVFEDGTIECGEICPELPEVK